MISTRNRKKKKKSSVLFFHATFFSLFFFFAETTAKEPRQPEQKKKKKNSRISYSSSFLLRVEREREKLSNMKKTFCVNKNDIIEIDVVVASFMTRISFVSFTSLNRFVYDIRIPILSVCLISKNTRQC